MNYLFAAEYADVLLRFARSHVLLAFDFDGTLAPIVMERERAVMRERTASLFAAVCERYACAVISGRARDDVLGRLGGASVRHVVGNHGAEPGTDRGASVEGVARAREFLSRALEGAEGVEIEDKGLSLSLHYGRAARRDRAKEAIAFAISALPFPMRVVPGANVVNLLAHGAPHKGDALLSLCAREGVERALYVADDATDEDVFRLDHRHRVLCIRIGASQTSAASYYLRDQCEIDRLLEALVSLRNDVARP